MVDIVKVPALTTTDLEEFAYVANRSHSQADLANLRRQGLIMQRRLRQRDGPPRRLAALTKEGRRLPGLAPVVTFSYVDSGASAGSGFARHLAAYQPLFRQLASFRFLFISPKSSHFGPAEGGLQRRSQETPGIRSLRRAASLLPSPLQREDGDYLIPVTSDLEFLNEAKRCFHGEGFEGLYSAWRFGQLAEQALRDEFCQAKPERSVYFEAVHVSQHRSYLQRDGKGGERGMKDTVHPPPFTIPFTLR